MVPYDPIVLQRLLDATLLLEAPLDLAVLLHDVIDEARSMTGARFAALALAGESAARVAEVITVGPTPDEGLLGPWPAGQGLLGALVADGAFPGTGAGEQERRWFLPDVATMPSFLGVPIKARDRIYGTLYLTDKAGSVAFTGEDRAVATTLAVVAAIAIDHADLHRRARLAALSGGRERIARDLHGAVIQRMFRAALKLQGITKIGVPGAVADRLQCVISDLDDAIHEIRSVVFALRVEDPAGVDSTAPRGEQEASVLRCGGRIG